MTEGTGKWSVWGYDTSEGGDAFYPIDADYTKSPRHLKEYDTEKEALKRAYARLDELEISQPSHRSGGQGYFGIQDQVYVQRPDGTMYRVSSKPSQK